MSHNPTLSPESVGGGVRGAMPLEYLEEDYEAGVDALPQQLRWDMIMYKCIVQLSLHNEYNIMCRNREML